MNIYFVINIYLQIQSSCMSIIYLISRDMKIKFIMYYIVQYIMYLYCSSDTGVFFQLII